MKIGNYLLRIMYALGISSLNYVIINYGKESFISLSTIGEILIFSGILFIAMLIEKYYFRNDNSKK